MKPLSDWPAAERRNIVGVFTDIDDTLTTLGEITPDALQALADLKAAGLVVIAITGRPVGWCEPLARSWPLDVLVAENGAVALVPNISAVAHDETGLAHSSNTCKKLSKLYQQDADERSHNYARMQQIATQVLQAVPGVQLTRDHAGRETDLAFDYREFAQLTEAQAQQVLALLQATGMFTTVSSIHIHGCFGRFNKWLGALWIVRALLQRELAQELGHWVFVGDSGNDESMFEHLRHSMGVANVRQVTQKLRHLPTYITPSERGAGFAEVAGAILQAR